MDGCRVLLFVQILELCHPGNSHYDFLPQAGKDSILHHLCGVHPVAQLLVLIHFCWTETLLFQQVNNNCSQGLRKLISLHNANYVKQEWKSLLEYKPVIRKLLDWFIANESAVKCFRGVQSGEKAYLIHYLPDMSFSKVNPVTMPIDVINY